EKNQVATALGFVLSNDKVQPFAQDADSKDYPFTAIVFPTDMNKDGKEEIFVQFGNSYTSGNTETSISLFIKNTSGVYKNHLGFFTENIATLFISQTFNFLTPTLLNYPPKYTKT